MNRFLLAIAILFIVVPANAQVTITPVAQYVLTPNTEDTIGAFCRNFYHVGRNKFYTVYAARPAGSSQPAGVLDHFAWREYDASFNFTGNHGNLFSTPGAGDFAMVQVDSTYFHLTMLGPTDYLLSKFDDDFVLLDTVHILLDGCDSNIDQLLNYTNGRLIIGAMQETTYCPPTNPPNPNYQPHTHIFQYDTNLNSIATDVVASPVNIGWGSSMIYNAGYYYNITMNNFNNHQLYVYKFDPNFVYQSQTLLSNDGQWSQGVIWDAPYYYVAYHTGDHNRGNVLLGVYDVNWALVTTVNVTSYPMVANGFNANRPVITKVGNLFYISYDVESYINAPPPINQKNWQSHVDVFQVSVSSGINEQTISGDAHLYPNPAADLMQLQFALTQPATHTVIAITDVTGRVCWEETLENLPAGNQDQAIPLTNLRAGIYTCTLTIDDEVRVMKLMKE